VDAIKVGFSEAMKSTKEYFASPSGDKVKGALFGGGLKDLISTDEQVKLREQKKMLDFMNFDYSKSDEPRQLNKFFGAGRNNLILRGEELSGDFKGKELEIEYKKYNQSEKGMNIPAGDLIKIFAYAMENGISKMTKDQASEIIEKGFKPQTETLKQLHIQMKGDKTNSVYSTE
jgi:hypothetical protein